MILIADNYKFENETIIYIVVEKSEDSVIKINLREFLESVDVELTCIKIDKEFDNE